MATTKMTKVAEVRPLPRTESSTKTVKQVPRILSQAKLNSASPTATATTVQQQPMTINLNAGQVLLPIVGAASPQAAQPIVLRCTIPQASLNTNTLSTSSAPMSLPSTPNIIIQQLTTPSSGSISSVPNLQLLQPLLQNIIQQNQSSNIAKVIIMPSTSASNKPNSGYATAPALNSFLSTATSLQQPPLPILKIPGYDSISSLKTNSSSKMGPTSTVSKPPETTDNSFSTLTISNVFSLNEDNRLWGDTDRHEVITSDDDDDMDQSDDVINHPEDDDLIRGDCHQVKAARRAAARIKKAAFRFPTDDGNCYNQGDISMPMRLSDNVEVYETTPEVFTDVELGKYKPKSNTTSKILFATNAPIGNQSKFATPVTKCVTKPSPPKIPRMVPKNKGTPIIISSPTASRNVDDYIVPLPKCIPKDTTETTQVSTMDTTEEDLKNDLKKRGKIKVPQWKVGYVKRKKKKKSSAGHHSETTSGTSVEDKPVSDPVKKQQKQTKNSKAKKSKDNTTPGGYTTIRSLLNAPLGQMVTRRRSASQQAEVIEIDDKSEDSLSNPPSPSNPQGAAAKKQLRMMLLTKGKDKQDGMPDEEDGEMNGVMVSSDTARKEDDNNTSDNGQALEHRGNSNTIDTDDEFKSDDDMPVLEPETSILVTPSTEHSKPEKKRPLKVKLCLKTTKRKGRKGKKSCKGEMKSWNVASEHEQSNSVQDPILVEKDVQMEEEPSLIKAQQTALLDNNPDEAATSGAEDDPASNLPNKAVQEEEDLKKSKTHKHKRKSKRKRKRKRDETEKPDEVGESLKGTSDKQ